MNVEQPGAGASPYVPAPPAYPQPPPAPPPPPAKSDKGIFGWLCCCCAPATNEAQAVAAYVDPVAGVLYPNLLRTPDLINPAPSVHKYGPYLRFGGYDPATRQWAVSVLLVTHQSKCPTPPTLKFKDADGGAEGYITGSLLDHHQGWTFWRFNLVVECGPAPRTLEYHCELPTEHLLHHHHRYRVAVPGATQAWHWGAYSCNGFHDPEQQRQAKGIQPLWRDVMHVHKENPFHVMLGGGDQLYNDAVWQAPALVAWCSLPDVQARYQHPFTQDMINQVHDYYFRSYLTQWSQDVFGDAMSVIPQVMTWDDHDIWDGWGSYPQDLQACPVFQGVYTVARKFYCLFQQHSTPERIVADNGVFGAVGWNQLVCLGQTVAAVALDARSERTPHQVLSAASWKMVKDRITALPATVRHVIVLATVPMIYPKLPVVEAALSYLQGDGRSRWGVVQMLQKSGLADTLMSQFGTVEILDDLMDHWSAEHHAQERLEAVHMMQELAQSRGFRFTLLSGDVHVGAVGRFLSEPKQNLKTDHRYIPQITTSAIGNLPPPDGVVNALTSFAAPAMLDQNTKELMVSVFGVGKKVLCPARNWVSVREAPFAPASGVPDADGSLTFQFRVEVGEPGSGTRPDTYEVSVPPLELTAGAPQGPLALPAAAAPPPAFMPAASIGRLPQSSSMIPNPGPAPLTVPPPPAAPPGAGPYGAVATPGYAPTPGAAGYVQPSPSDGYVTAAPSPGAYALSPGANGAPAPPGAPTR